MPLVPLNGLQQKFYVGVGICVAGPEQRFPIFVNFINVEWIFEVECEVRVRWVGRQARGIVERVLEALQVADL